ncbi:MULTISPECIES: hypothetical protein [unclassified Neisseria]|uniref:hypothetical protein n=1 Tax=unclassified Neisseria TaxID=2623750 RepID=UPI00107267D7|nr:MULTISPECIES: hypothetical protein [unclassified Neisseria]MBF0803902.1 hypothetical protein [Neisseria sp. 19428wB4_WF04]TFU43329.1 hypothetical protein E4T99_05960 [Neisseria sp. WF04]
MGYQVGRICHQTHDEATNAVMPQAFPTKYGNQVKVPSKITRTAYAAIIAGAVGSAASKAVDIYSEQLGSSIKQGNDLGAAHHAVMTAGATLDNLPGVVRFLLLPRLSGAVSVRCRLKTAMA